MEQRVRPRWRDRLRAVAAHVLATAGAAAALGVLAGLLIVGVGSGGPGGAALVASVPITIITGTSLGLLAGVLTAPWGIARAAAWTRPVITGAIGAFHLAGRVERSRTVATGSTVGDLGESVAIAIGLWAAVSLAVALSEHRDGWAPAATGWPAREAIGATTAFAVTIVTLAVRA